MNYLANKEFNKIIRFNGRSYLLHSIYDNMVDDEFDYDDALSYSTSIIDDCEYGFNYDMALTNNPYIVK